MGARLGEIRSGARDLFRCLEVRVTGHPRIRPISGNGVWT
jgi:hypothetical protein